MATIYDVLDAIRETSENTHQKGLRFELATKYFFRNDPAWRQRFSNVWMWEDAPVRKGPDTGIDLVAQEADTGQYWAIQCKCYDENYYLQKKDIDSFFNEAGKEIYVSRIVVAATENWSRHALESVDDWEALRILPRNMMESPIDWDPFLSGRFDEVALRNTFDLRPHQKKALKDVLGGLDTDDRGQLIMACGTGKTLTSLRIAEKMAPTGRILFLVPSISLLSQTLREWSNQANVTMRSYAVCSDTKVGVRKGGEDSDISLHDLPYPATTDPKELAKRMNLPRAREAMTVVFSTYQSIQVIADAQKAGCPEFDLIVCDEAHRTTGAKGIAEADESYFTKVHDNSIIRGKRRLYMTATPRIYGQTAKEKARELSFEVSSMDDEEKFGRELHNLGFGTAVEEGLLTDYRVLVLTVSEDEASKTFQEMYVAEDGELPLPERAKIIGCWNGLQTRGEEIGEEERPHPMRRAVAFCGQIKDSQRMKEKFEGVIEAYALATGDDAVFRCEVDHVDGGMNALERNRKLDWLRDVGGTQPENCCRILSNARCLSEGIDVPALDAVIFMKPRRSKVDIIQAVGRVMRKAEAKDYGYIILPICVPAGVRPEDALDDNKNFEVVWEILQALRSHDERFNAMINAIKFDNQSPVKVKVVGEQPATGGVGEDGQVNETAAANMQDEIIQLALNFPVEDWQKAINAKIVEKVGTRVYWQDWAKDVARVAEQYIARIAALVDSNIPAVDKAFEDFLVGMRESENSGITRSDAIEMLAQHLITAPVFDALFKDYSFVDSNPVSRVMQGMVTVLEEHRLDAEDETLQKFYDSVRRRISGIDTDAGRQSIIKELYENFFSAAFKRTAESMGIVYTPLEVVDFILHSVNDALAREFGQTIGDQGVHVLDPFTGTGTFIVRLLQSGLIGPDQLKHKYEHELHANEIVLLAYYIASINIEHTYHGITDGDYLPFPGGVLTDTFQMSEGGDTLDVEMFVENSERILKQLETPIRVIVGNPPYSIGQRSANDNNKNLSYDSLDGRIQQTYAARSGASNVRGLYDSYIRAFRWASDRIGNAGIVCFVSNAGWLDAAGMDGFRKRLAEEFTSVHVFNLRGNARTSGEQRRREKDNVFGQGTRTPIAVTMLVKNPAATATGKVFYHDIGDYLSREEKLRRIVEFDSMEHMSWDRITPDANGDWLNQRDEAFEAFIPMGSGKSKSTAGIFAMYSPGLVSARDVWVYNYSASTVASRVAQAVEFYESERRRFVEAGTPADLDGFVSSDTTLIKWSRGLKNDLRRDKPIVFRPTAIVQSMYRPFCKQMLYFDRQMDEMVGQQHKLFPSPGSKNLAICVPCIGNRRPFSAIITDAVPDFHVASDGIQAFPLFWYQEQRKLGGLFEEHAPGYVRHDGITDETLQSFRGRYKASIAKEDIFYYVYGVLHSAEYRERFASTLKKELPRIPFCAEFESFRYAGKKLADLHLNYESAEPWPLEEVAAGTGASPSYRVEKLRFPKNGSKADHSRIVVNATLELRGIPEDAYRYELDGRSAIGWIIDRYQVRADKSSGIVNDPNEWSDDPRYIVDLVKRIVRVSIETMEIVDALPPLNEVTA
jgi:predicted helicase